MKKPKLIRITTVPQSLSRLLKGQLSYMNENGFEVIGVSSPGESLKEVELTEKIPTYSVLMKRTISPISDLKAVWKLYKIFKKEKPEIVHTHTPKAGTVGMLAALLAGVPIRLHTVAGLPLMEASGKKRMLLDFVEKLTYQWATKIYPNSKGLCDFITAQKYTSALKLKVIGNGSSNGIDSDEFDPSLVSIETKENLKASLGIGKNEFIFLFVGRLVKDKGLNELVKAFQQLNQDYNDIHLVLVGKYEDELDPLDKQTMQLIRTNPRIHETGYVNNVIDYLGLADVFVFPSYREGFPNVVMQAASMQVNAIVTNINGSNEIVQNGKNGWIVDVKNDKQLREKMSWCYLNKAESIKMGQQSRQVILDKFERRFIWEEIKNEYKNLMVLKNV